jgi:hypothetical protein
MRTSGRYIERDFVRGTNTDSVARRLRMTTAITMAALSGLLMHTQAASGVGSAEAASPIFGATVVDIALTLDDAAKRSLLKSPDTDVGGQMRVTDAHGAVTTYAVRIHIKGERGSARPLDSKPAFKVKLRRGDQLYGLKELTLNNMVQDYTMLHEALGYQVYEAAGVAVPATGYARVSLNGEPYGLYLNLETIDTQFLMRQFGNQTGILYEGSYGVDLRLADVEKFNRQEGKDPDRARLRTLIHAVDTPGDAVFYGAPPQVDTRSFLAMMAAGTLLADWDNYYHSNNYRIYWNSATERWVFIPTGIDQTFGSRSTAPFGGTGVLFQKCLASERCTVEYAATVRDLADRFETLNLTARMDALLAVIDTASREDPKKNYSVGTMNNAREAMRVFIERRPSWVREALSCLDGPQEVAVGACAGVVTVNAAVDQCLEVVRDDAARNAGGIGVGPCSGGPNQRWRLLRTGEAFALTSVAGGACLSVKNASHDDGAPVALSSCSDADHELFSVTPLSGSTQLVARHSGKCLASVPAPGPGADVVQLTCADDLAQTWRVQRSIYP